MKKSKLFRNVVRTQESFSLKKILGISVFLSAILIGIIIDDFYCINDVVNEAKDKQTKQFINSLPITIQFREPTVASVKFIIEFTKKTGDYASLSLTDIKIIALTYDLEIEKEGSNKHLRSEPLHSHTEQLVSNCPPSSLINEIEGFYDSFKKSAKKSAGSLANITNEIHDDENSPINFSTTKQFLSSMDFHFQEYTYIDGYLYSENDKLLFSFFKDSFSSFMKLCDVFEVYKDGSNLNYFLYFCRDLLNKFENNKTYKIFEESTLNLEKIISIFCEDFYLYSNLVRWLLHILCTTKNYTENYLPSDVKKLLDQTIFIDRTPNKENNYFKNKETDNEIQEDFSYENSDSDDDGCSDDDGWITPSNIKFKTKLSENPAVDVACLTTDFAMQNTLKHIGLSVIGFDGKIISNVRTFILRCFTCFKTTDKIEKIFCPNCGHKTLKKVSVTSNPDGTKMIWISTKKSINTKGMKYSLPKPQGGKHAINPLLVADQRQAQQRVSRMARLKNNPMSEDFDYRSGGTPFLTRDVHSRSALLGITTGKKVHRGLLYFEQRNPNVPMKKGISKRKK